jgi:hypothetical protein
MYFRIRQTGRDICAVIQEIERKDSIIDRKKQNKAIRFVQYIPDCLLFCPSFRRQHLCISLLFAH